MTRVLQLVPLLPSALLAGCETLSCGPGTVREGTQCVVADPAGSDSGGADSAPGGDSDSAPADSGPDSGGDSGRDTGGDTAPTEPPIEVYILSGQSNMDGWSPVSGLPPSLQVAQPDVRLYWSTDGALGPLEPSSNKGLQYTGPEVSMGRTLADAGRDVVLVKHAWAGTTMQTYWYPGLSDADPAAAEGWILLRQAMDATAAVLDAEGRPWRWAGAAMLQGETDSWDETARTNFADNLALFVARLREVTGEPDLPFVMGELRCDVQCTYNDLIEEGQAQVAAADPAFILIDNDDLGQDPEDPKHFDGAGIRVVGERLAQALLGEPYSPPPEPALALDSWTADRNGTYTLGWSFSLDAPLTITDIGCFAEGELQSATEWGIWTEGGGTLVGRGVIPSTTQVVLSRRDPFWYLAIEPIALPAGDYVVALTSTADDGDTHAHAATGAVAPGITFGAGRFIGADGLLNYPTYTGGRDLSFTGPNFLFTR